jgi:hypothetical protein
MVSLSFLLRQASWALTAPDPNPLQIKYSRFRVL